MSSGFAFWSEKIWVTILSSGSMLSFFNRISWPFPRASSAGTTLTTSPDGTAEKP